MIYSTVHCPLVSSWNFQGLINWLACSTASFVTLPLSALKFNTNLSFLVWKIDQLCWVFQVFHITKLQDICATGSLNLSDYDLPCYVLIQSVWLHKFDLGLCTGHLRQAFPLLFDMLWICIKSIYFYLDSTGIVCADIIEYYFLCLNKQVSRYTRKQPSTSRRSLKQRTRARQRRSTVTRRVPPTRITSSSSSTLSPTSSLPTIYVAVAYTDRTRLPMLGLWT